MLLGGAKDEHFSYFHSSCQLGLRSCEKKSSHFNLDFTIFSHLSGQVFIIYPNVLNSCWIEKMFWSILFWLSNVSKNKIIWLKIRRIWQKIVGRWVKTSDYPLWQDFSNFLLKTWGLFCISHRNSEWQQASYFWTEV